MTQENLHFDNNSRVYSNTLETHQTSYKSSGSVSMDLLRFLMIQAARTAAPTTNDTPPTIGNATTNAPESELPLWDPAGEVVGSAECEASGEFEIDELGLILGELLGAEVEEGEAVAV